MKSEDIRNKIIVDEYAGKIVRDIFEWKKEGMSQHAISDKLNRMGILSPMEYKQANGLNFATSFKVNSQAKWSSQTIGRILRNEIYTGVLIQGKRTTPNYRIKKVVCKDEADWIRIEDSHEALVSRRDFNIVQSILDADTRTAPNDLMRGIKNKNFWTMEQQSGPCGWQVMGDTPEPGQIRLWTYQALAHGAEAMVYFRWRTALFGTEQYWHGILDHDGLGRRRYQEIIKIGEELKSLNELFVDSININEVALIKSYDNVWSHRVQPYNRNFDYNGLLCEYYVALNQNNISLDVTSVDVDFTQYKWVLMPAFNLMTEAIKNKCEDYVSGGGNLLITFRSGTRNWNNSMSTLTNPGYFKELAGIELEEYDSINFGRSVEVSGGDFKGQAKKWCDIIKCNNAQVLATYESHYYIGKPAVTVNQYEKGQVYYVGCDLNETALASLIKGIAQDISVDRAIPGVEGVDIVKKEKGGKTFIVMMNHNNNPKWVAVAGEYNNVMTGEAVKNNICIEAYGVVILV